MKIALIEDEVNLNEAIKIMLELEDYDVHSYKNIREFLKDSENNFDIIIADISLPDGNFLQEIAKHKKISEDTKVMIMSAHGELDNIKKAFDLGAEDFIKKPFEPEEIVLRVKKLFKNHRTKLADNIYYDPESKTVITPDSKEILTKKEAMLLELLIKNRGKFVSFETIASVIWNEPVTSNTIAALVKRLRQKVGDKNLITSKREIGYMLI